MKTIRDIDFKNKTALVRCDFNVSFNDSGEITDDFRIRESIPTIKYILDQGGKVLLATHMKKEVKHIIPLIEDLLGEKVNLVKDGVVGDVSILENIRSFKGEIENDDAFAQELASMADVYVNEAFSVSHRAHASVAKTPLLMPNCVGLLFEKEVKVLSRAKDNPWKPLVVIIGGSKVPSKVKVVRAFLEKADHILLGGKVANDILVVKGISVNKPWPKEDVVSEIESIDLTSTKLHLPVDVKLSNSDGSFNKIDAPGAVKNEEEIYDIGPETIKIYSDIIAEAGMIVWAGPLGFFEKKEFELGTKEIACAVARNNKAFRIIGGGDTGVAISKFNIKKGVDHISTGGGAMLDFLANKELPGLKALNYYDQD
ncbi:MAG: phosphoglycerate kinase [Candidatus Pacebacteria bacterium]|nr:phosphoglycerate kinase [Candidatus Paceibacterota bacterium]